MKIPKVLFGKGKEVHSRVSRLMAKAKKTWEWPTFPDSEMIDTETLPKGKDGPKVLFKPDPLLGGEEHFRLYAFGRYFKFGRGVDVVQKEGQFIFDGLVKTPPWGLLALLCKETPFPRPNHKGGEERAREFFRLLEEYWSLFQEEKVLFEDEIGKSFWEGNRSQLWTVKARWEKI